MTRERNLIYVPLWFRVVSVLETSMKKGLSLTMIHKRSGVLIGAVSLIVNELEEKGFVMTHKTDRQKFVWLTKEGKKIRDAVLVMAQYV